MSQSTNEIGMDESEGGVSLWSFMLGVGAGVAIGIVGTVLFAAYSEEQFVRVARKTKEIGDQAQDKASQVKDSISTGVNTVAEATKKHVEKVKDRLQGSADELQNRSEELISRS